MCVTEPGMIFLVPLVLGANKPCPGAIPAFAAYETLLRSEAYYPLAAVADSRAPMAFSGSDTWESAYLSARHRIDKLAILAAQRSGCEIEELGCFEQFLGAHNALMAVRAGGGNATLQQPAFQPFREKALGWAMYNLVWLVENCEAAVAKQRKEKKTSKVGTVAFPTPP